MATTVVADFGGGVNVTAVMGPSGIQYTINLANGSSAGPYTGDQLIDVGSGTQTMPLPAEFRLTYKNQTIATSNNNNDIVNGGDIVLNLFAVQQNAEAKLAVAPSTTVADIPANAAVTPPPSSASVVPTAVGTTAIAASSDPAIAAPNTPSQIASQSTSAVAYNPAADSQAASVALTAPPVVGNNPSAYVAPGIDYVAPPVVFNAAADSQAASVALAAPPVVGNNPSAYVAPGADAIVAPATNTTRGLTTAAAATAASATTSSKLTDWRAKLSLAPSSNYLYNASNPGILAPLKQTQGIIFPYTPAIQVAYAAHYDSSTLTHSNYKIFQYGSSSVDSISITCDFTAQDTAEANYLLAVIHFFKTATKMFYGQDSSPKNGTPPPLCYLTGFGAFQFDAHPLAITAFNYSLPIDVDYIRASAAAAPPGVSTASAAIKPADITLPSAIRVANANLTPGAVTALPAWSNYPGSAAPTYVPTKMQIQISAIPIVTRNDISNDFSLEKYATGVLLQGSSRAGRGGIW